MCLPNELPERVVAFPRQVPAPRRRVQPLTWIVSVALTPVLLYDVWQTVQDVHQRHAAAAATAGLSSTAASRLVGGLAN